MSSQDDIRALASRFVTVLASVSVEAACCVFDGVALEANVAQFRIRKAAELINCSPVAAPVLVVTQEVHMSLPYLVLNDSADLFFFDESSSVIFSSLICSHCIYYVQIRA